MDSLLAAMQGLMAETADLRAALQQLRTLTEAPTEAPLPAPSTGAGPQAPAGSAPRTPPGQRQAEAPLLLLGPARGHRLRDPATSIARHLQADCFEFATDRSARGPRQGRTRQDA